MAGPIAIAAGGSGGHMFPARAFAACLKARGEPVIAVTDRRGAAFAGDAPAHIIRAAAPRSLRGLACLALGVLDARRVLRRAGARAVVGFGGYPSAPTVLAARWLGLATVLHEQNAVLGRANRLLARGRVRVAGGFPGLGERFVGNPVRPEIAALAERPYRPPAAGEKLRLLVFGGSQGAHVFSAVLPEALAPLAGRLTVRQQCRPEDLEAARAAYLAAGVEARLEPFIEDMADALAEAHLVIARAGASTVAELAAAGRPAILVPYPHAMDDHQSVNARSATEAGGGWLLPESDFTAARVRELVEARLDDPEGLAAAAAAAGRGGRPQAADALADFVLDAAGRAAP